jgi:microcin C transport system substrate-binding protein
MMLHREATQFRITLILCLIALALCGGRAASADERAHGLSAFGSLKYPAQFEHFDYVDEQAPKGGRLSMIGTADRITFNSFNNYILKGDPAQGLGLLFDSLMVRAWDEPDAVYGLVAASAELAPDRSTATFDLRPEAKFADGSPVTAQDVIFSLDILKEKGNPNIRLPLKDVIKAEALDDRTVRYSFQGERTRDLPLFVAALPIFSKAYYSNREFDQTTLAPPLGSGPYEIADFKQGTYVVYRRRPDYWAKDLPVNRGRYNFDELRYEYFRDRTAELEALKANAYDLREEFTSRDWSTAYKIPQVRSGRMQLLELPDARPSGAQGFFINIRRPEFQDIRVRKALDYAFDFEWTNKNLFYDLYKRTDSFFENSGMKAEGEPGAAELELLEPYRDKLPPEVFGAVYKAPKTDGSGQDRRKLRIASKLLDEAGWTVQEGTRKNAKGEPLKIEFLIFSPGFERVIAPYVKNLKLLGIDASIRRVDPSQYEQRVKDFDFDIAVQRYSLNLTPGVELRNYWGSAAARTSGSFNLSGINDPVVDALIEKVIEAKSRDQLETATKALDRVLRAGHYWVPHWYKAAHNIAYWNKFGRPETKPLYDRGVIETWWYDEAKAAKLAANR